MPVQQKFPEGVRPGSKGGIEIRWSVAGKPYSRYIKEAPTANALSCCFSFATSYLMGISSVCKNVYA